MTKMWSSSSTIVLELFLGLSVVFPAHSWCPTDWLAYNNACYRTLTSKMTYEAGKQQCESFADNVRLPVLSSMAEFERIKAMGGSGDTWLGLSRNSLDCKEWEWASGAMITGFKQGNAISLAEFGVDDWGVGFVDGVAFECAKDDEETCSRIAQTDKSTSTIVAMESTSCGEQHNVVCQMYGTCTDLIQNQEETGLDCGGSGCPVCEAWGGSAEATLSFKSARGHMVFPPVTAALSAPVYYAAVSFAYNERLTPIDSNFVVAPDSVFVRWNGAYTDTGPCLGALEGEQGFLGVVEQIGCAPPLLFRAQRCPQALESSDKFAQINVPIILPAGEENLAPVEVEFRVELQDAEGNQAIYTLTLPVDTSDMVRWCEASPQDQAATDPVLARLSVGTDESSPKRVYPSGGVVSSTSSARDVQEGLVTLVLESTEDEETAAFRGISVAVEEVVVIHVNPGYEVDLLDIVENMPDRYFPAPGPSGLVLPSALTEECPEEDKTKDAEGCVHKHVIRGGAVVKSNDVHMVGSSGAQDFMATMLAGTEAAEEARTLGETFEWFLVNEEKASAANPLKLALWINPGHKWGDSDQYSRSEDLGIFVQYKVTESDGSVRRRMLQAGASTLGVQIAYTVGEGGGGIGGGGVAYVGGGGGMGNSVYFAVGAGAVGLIAIASFFLGRAYMRKAAQANAVVEVVATTRQREVSGSIASNNGDGTVQDRMDKVDLEQRLAEEEEAQAAMAEQMRRRYRDSVDEGKLEDLVAVEFADLHVHRAAAAQTQETVQRSFMPQGAGGVQPSIAGSLAPSAAPTLR